MNTKEMIMRKKRKIFHVHLYRLGLMANKADIIGTYGVESTLDLSENELDELIYRLKQMEVSRWEPTPLMRQWRSNVLTVINALGIYATNDDWSRVNAFLLDSRIAGKLLYELSVPELKKLYRKLLSIKSKQKPLHKITYSLN